MVRVKNMCDEWRCHSTHFLILTLEAVSGRFLVSSPSMQRPRDIISTCVWFGCERILYCGKQRTVARICKESKTYSSVVEPTKLDIPTFEPN